MFSLRVKTAAFMRPMSVSRQAIAARQFQSQARVYARKDTQDRESMNVDPNEYSKSGGDGATARTSDVAFSRSETRPEEAIKEAGKETEGTDQSNPLDGSPANTDLGKPTKPTKEGSQAEDGNGESGRARSSGGGSAPKNG